MGEKMKGMSLKMRIRYRRITAYLLTFVMLFTNVGSNVSVALAANPDTTASAIFGLSGDDIRDAALEAIEGGTIFDYASLNLDAEDSSVKAKYADLLGSGYVYEIYPDMEDGSAPAGTELRMFIRTKEEGREGYNLTGDEQMVFLFINSSNKRVEFYASVDGVMTSKVTVKPFAAAAEVPKEEPVATPGNADKPKPNTGGNTGDTTAPEENGPGVEDETTAPEEVGPGVSDETEEAPTEAPVETPTEAPTEAPAETPTEVPTEAPTEAPAEIPTEAPTEAPAETPTEAPTETPAEIPTEAPTEAPAETPTEAPTEAPAETPTEAPTELPVETPTEAPTETLAETPAETPTEAESLTVGISHNEVALVADTMDGTAEDAGEIEAEEKSEEPKETVQADFVIETEPETTAAAEETVPEAEITFPDETTAAVQPTEEETAEAVVPETTAAAKETTAADEDDYEIPEDKSYYEGIELIDDVTPEEELEKEVHDSGNTDGRIYGEAEIDGRARARAFVTTLRDMNINVDADELAGNESLRTVVDGVTIRILAASGVLPEGTRVIAESVDSEQIRSAVEAKLGKKNRVLTNYQAFDIFLVDEDGNDVEFDGKVTVTFEDIDYDGGQTEVFHVTEPGISTFSSNVSAKSNAGGYYTAEEIPSHGSGSVVSFETTHFSVYVLTESIEAQGYHTVRFMDGHTHELIALQMIEDGGNAIEPAIPDHDGYRFTGWDRSFTGISADTTVTAQYAQIGSYNIRVDFVYENGSMAAQPFTATVEKGVPYSKIIDIPQIPGYTTSPAYEENQLHLDYGTDVTEDQKLTVTYVGSDINYIVKHMLQDVADEKRYVEVLEDRQIIPIRMGQISNAEAKEYPGFTANAVQNVKVVEDGMEIEVRYDRKYYTLTFDSDGGSYVPSMRYKYDAIISTPTAPERLGYTFQGWQNMPSDWRMPSEDITVKAIWIENTRASYTVIYWQQKVEDGTKYDFVEQTVKTNARVNDIATFDDKSNLSAYKGFKLNRDKSSDVVRVTSDGKAVKNVYYDRETFSVKLYLYENTGRYNYDWVLKKTITAKYGENIVDQWPDGYTSYSWGESYDWSNQVNSPYRNIVVGMGNSNLTLYGKKMSGSNQYIEHYLADLTSGYTLKTKINLKGEFYLTEDEDILNFDGFEFSSFTPSNAFKNSKWTTAKLYYNRKNYTIEFSNVRNVRSQSIPYEKSINSYKPTNPAAANIPAGMDSDYIFDGWYTSPACEDGTEVDWNTTMPSHNMVFYAKWVAPEYTVKFDTHEGTPEPSAIRVTKGESIQDRMPEDPVREGYEFAGWYTDTGYTNPFINTRLIISNLTLHAKWVRSGIYEYTVYMRDADNPAEQLQSPIPNAGPANETVVVDAPSIDGWLPTVLSQNLLLDQDNKTVTFYYKKAIEWEYTVRYLDQNGEEIETALVETTQADSLTIFWKQIDGYVLDTDKSSYSQIVTQGNPEIVFYYQANVGKYKVEHYLENILGNYDLQTADTEEDTSLVGSTVVAEPNSYDGYECITKEINRAGIIPQNGTVVIKVFYNLLRSDLTIHYVYENGDEAAEDYTARLATGKNYSVASPAITGYIPDPEVVAGVKENRNEEFTVIYMKNDDETKELNYKVQHWVGNETTPRDTVPVTVDIWVNDDSTEVTEVDHIVYSGYQFDHYNPSLPATVKEGGVINVYYVKDDTATKELNYEVQHWVGNETAPRDTVPVTVDIWVNDDRTEVTEVVQNTYPGYKFNRYDPALPTTVREGGVIKVYYVKDDTATKKLNYEVKHWVGEEETPRDTIPVSMDIWVNDDSAEVRTVARNTYPGYQFDHYNPALPTTVREGDVINVYYVKDDTATKTLNYEVKHWVSGEETPRDTIPVSVDIWVNDNTTEVAAVGQMIYPGYQFDHYEPTLPATIGEGDVINVYYVKDDDATKKLNYEVRHWVGSETAPRDTESVSVDIWVNDISTVVDTVAQNTYPGYKFSHYNPVLPATVREGGVINVYYVKDDEATKTLNYTVKHWVGREITPRDEVPMSVEIWVNDNTAEVTAVAQNTYTGYKFSHYNPSIPVEVSNGDTINVYYVKDEAATKKLNYKVRHWVGNETDPRDEETVSVDIWVNASVTEVTAVDQNSYTGYKFDRYDPTIPTTVSEGDIINVYYVKDDAVTKNLNYEVKHWVGNEAEPRDVVPVSVDIWVNDSSAKVDAVAQNSYTGYKFDHYDPNLPTAVSEGGVINVYYVKDDSVTKKLNYEVKHWVGSEETPRDTVPASVEIWVNDSSTVVDTVVQNSYTGYQFDHYNPELPTTVSEGGIINVYYIKDDSAVKKLDYEVQHWVEGEEIPRDIVPMSVDIWVNDDSTEVTTVETKTYAGYKFSRYAPSIPTTVNEGDIIKVYYVKDDTATKKLNYEVKHWVGSEETPRDTVPVSVDVWVNDNSTEVATVAQNTYPGYQFDRYTPGLPATVGEGDTINVYYVKDEDATKKLNYEVKHWVGNETAPRDTVSVEVDIWVNDSSTVVDTVAQKTYAGYKFDRYTPGLPATVKDGDVINVYYVKDDAATKKLNYEVKHWVDSETEPRDTDSISVDIWVNDSSIVVDTVTQKTYTGYKFDRYEPVIPTTVEDGGVINVYYVKDDTATKELNYTVKHWVGRETIPRDEVPVSVDIWVNDSSTVVDAVAQKAYTGYKFSHYNPGIPTTVEEGGVINVYYVKDDAATKKLNYEVKHWVVNEPAPRDTDKMTVDVWVNASVAEVTAVNQNSYPGFKFDHYAPDIPTNVSEGDTINVYYVKDDTATKKLNYEVNHWVGNEGTPRDTVPVSVDIWVNDSSAEVTAVAQNTYPGYKFSHYDPSIPTVVREGDAINLYYVKDDTATKKLNYEVQHWVGSETTPRDTVPVSVDIWVNDSTTEVTDVARNTYTGYKFDRYDPDLPTTVSEGGVIKVYYVKDETATKKLNYKVRHWVGNETNPRDEETVSVEIWVNASTAKVTDVVQNSYLGYKFSHYAPNLPAEVGEGDVINVYYVKDETDKTERSYTVEYYKDNVLVTEDTQTETAEVWSGTDMVPVDTGKINTTDKYPGYAFIQSDPDPIPGEVKDGSVIKVYYAIRTDLGYTVTYIYEDETAAEIGREVSGRKEGTFNEPMAYTADSTRTYGGRTFVYDQVAFEGTDRITADEDQNKVYLYYALDELNEYNPEIPGEYDPEKPDGIADKYQLTFTYQESSNGMVHGIRKEVATRTKEEGKFSRVNPAYPKADVTAIADTGYHFNNWTSDNPGISVEKTAQFADADAIRNTGFAQNTVFTAHFLASDKTTYNIEVYYQDKGAYPSTPNKSIKENGTAGETVTIEPGKYQPAGGYKYDEAAGNVISGAIKDDNSLVLKLYFKQQFTVTYKPGTYGSFQEEVYSNLDYNADTPKFAGQTTANGRYRFKGWDKAIADKVTGDVVYTAEWSRISDGGGGGGGGGNGGGPNPNTPSTPGGPGVPTTMIEPGPVPLAMAPEEDNLVLIDDGEVPLAGLPKTGDAADGLPWMLLFSSMALVVHTILGRKKEDEN